jgi:hypothetical protein
MERKADMTGKSFFSSRLTGNKVDLWNLLCENEEERNEQLLNSFSHFCGTEGAMLFASYLGDELIGLAAVYLVREDKSAVLAGLRVQPDYRDSSTRQVIRSSLPLFRTANIQDVVAVVVKEKEAAADYFPLTSHLHNWSRDALDDLGFIQIGEINQCTINNISNSVAISSKYSSKYEHSKALEMISRIRNNGEIVPPNDLLGLDIGRRFQQVIVGTSHEVIQMLFTYVVLGNEIIFPVFLTEPDIGTNMVSDSFNASSARSDIDTLSFPSIRNSQIPVLKELASRLDGDLMVNSLVVMKKSL